MFWGIRSECSVLAFALRVVEPGLVLIGGDTPAYPADSLQLTLEFAAHRRLRSADSRTMLLPSTRRSTPGDRVSRGWRAGVGQSVTRDQGCFLVIGISAGDKVSFFLVSQLKAPMGWELGRGPPQRTRGSGERRELRHRPPTHFWHIWGPQNTSGRENSVTLASFFRKKIHSIDDGLLSPLWLRSCPNESLNIFANEFTRTLEWWALSVVHDD